MLGLFIEKILKMTAKLIGSYTDEIERILHTGLDQRRYLIGRMSEFADSGDLGDSHQLLYRLCDLLGDGDSIRIVGNLKAEVVCKARIALTVVVLDLNALTDGRNKTECAAEAVRDMPLGTE